MLAEAARDQPNQQEEASHGQLQSKQALAAGFSQKKEWIQCDQYRRMERYR